MSNRLNDALEHLDEALEALEDAKRELPFGIENRWLYLASSTIRKQRERLGEKAADMRADVTRMKRRM